MVFEHPKSPYKIKFDWKHYATFLLILRLNECKPLVNNVYIQGKKNKNANS